MILDKLTQRATLKNPPAWLIEALTGDVKTVSGETVSEKSALSLATYYACIRCIAEDVAKLPLLTYRKQGERNKKRLPGHRVYKLLHDSPNPEMTAFSFREVLTQYALGWGNGYAEIVRNLGNQVVEMWPLESDKVTVWREEDTGTVYYMYQAKPSGGYRRIERDDMLHIHGLGSDGILGYSVARKARQTIGLAIAEEKTGAAFFGNGSRPGGVIQHPGVLGEDARNNLRKSWEAIHGGASNAHKTAILEEGMEWKTVTIPNEDSQWIESRQHQVEEICRWFRMPPHKVQHLLRATFSNIEEQSLEYVTDTLMSWLVRWEQEIKRKLFMPHESNVFAEHLVEGLLRGDIKTRYSAYSTARQWGWMSANDIRELENQNDIGEQGDVYLVPMNMNDASKINEEPEPVVPEPVPDGIVPQDQPDALQDASVRLLIQDEIRKGLNRADSGVIDAVCKAHVPLLADTYRQIYKVLADKVERAKKKGVDFARWQTRFCSEHLEHSRTLLSVPVENYCASVWAAVTSEQPPDYVEEEMAEYVGHLAGEHVSRVRAMLEHKEGVSELVSERTDQRANRELCKLGHKLKVFLN